MSSSCQWGDGTSQVLDSMRGAAFVAMVIISGNRFCQNTVLLKVSCQTIDELLAINFAAINPRNIIKVNLSGISSHCSVTEENHTLALAYKVSNLNKQRREGAGVIVGNPCRHTNSIEVVVMANLFAKENSSVSSKIYVLGS